MGLQRSRYKTQRDNRDGQVDTSAWVIAVWIALAAAILLTGWGLWRMGIEQWQKYYMLVSWLFAVSSTFTLAKTVRDAQEAELLEQRLRARAVLRRMPLNRKLGLARFFSVQKSLLTEQ